MPQKEDWAWLAGIIDGEGSIAVSKVKTNLVKAGFRYSYFISIPNTELEIIEKARNICNMTKFIRTQNSAARKLTVGFKPTVKFKPIYILSITSKPDLFMVLTNCIPYLSGKKKAKAELLLKYVSSRLNKNQGKSNTIEETNILEAIRGI